MYSWITWLIIVFFLLCPYIFVKCKTKLLSVPFFVFNLRKTTLIIKPWLNCSKAEIPSQLVYDMYMIRRFRKLALCRRRSIISTAPCVFRPQRVSYSNKETTINHSFKLSKRSTTFFAILWNIKLRVNIKFIFLFLK